MKSEKFAAAMRREIVEKAVLAYMMVSWYALMPVTGYENYSIMPIENHIVYMWSHANIWHLAGNLFVLWLWRGRLYPIPSIAIAFLCSLIPAFGLWPIGMTVGFSGVLFAMVGIKWGIYCRKAPFRHLAFAEFCMKALPFGLIFVVVPHVNWCLHLYCMLAGFAYGLLSCFRGVRT